MKQRFVSHAGVIWLIASTTTTHVQSAILGSCPTQLAPQDGRESTLLGWAVAGRKDLVIAGTDSGSVYVFARRENCWFQQQRLTGANPVPYDGFGKALSLDGETLIVGAPQENDFAGAAYIHVRSGNQ